MCPDCSWGLVASSPTFCRNCMSESASLRGAAISLTLRFMALEPHPCPEIIYWAADSKQLVIAQPDRVCFDKLAPAEYIACKRDTTSSLQA